MKLGDSKLQSRDDLISLAEKIYGGGKPVKSAGGAEKEEEKTKNFWAK